MRVRSDTGTGQPVALMAREFDLIITRTAVVLARRRPSLKTGLRERRWFVLERPRRDTNGGSETEVTVTSKLPSKYRKKEGDRRETEKRREGSIPGGLRQRLDELSGGCAKRSAAESGGRRPECPE